MVYFFQKNIQQKEQRVSRKSKIIFFLPEKPGLLQKLRDPAGGLHRILQQLLKSILLIQNTLPVYSGELPAGIDGSIHYCLPEPFRDDVPEDESSGQRDVP